MTVAYVTGVQGDIPGRFKAAALLKHFPANNEDARASTPGTLSVSGRSRKYFLPPSKPGYAKPMRH